MDWTHKILHSFLLKKQNGDIEGARDDIHEMRRFGFKEQADECERLLENLTKKNV